MEPTLPVPHGSPEMGPTLPYSPEMPPAQQRERQGTTERPASQELQPGADASAPAAPPMPIVPLPTAQPVSSAPGTQQAADDGNPVVAADDDLIEKEWVEKAKRVISETKHDPFAQEKAVSRLQADYLQKRYGKVIKLPSED